jgi:hypothetical protein
MIPLLSRFCTIIDTGFNDEEEYYILEEDDSHYHWTTEMFDLIIPSKPIVEKKADNAANLRKECLQEAEKCVCHDRDNQYGLPENSFKIIAELWGTYKGTRFTTEDVAIMMALLKIARIKTGAKKKDNYIDLAGYAACAMECAMENIVEI